MLSSLRDAVSVRFLIEKSSSPPERDPVAIAQQRRHLVGDGGRLVVRVDLDHDRAGDELLQPPLDLGQEGGDGDEHHVVVVAAAGRLPLALGDAGHLEGDVLDAHDLAGRIGVGPEQSFGDGLPEHHDLGARVGLLGRQPRPEAHRPVADLEELRRRPVDDGQPVAVLADDLPGGVDPRRDELHVGDVGLDGAQIVPGQGGKRAGAGLGAAGRLGPRRDDEDVGAHRSERLLDAGPRPFADRHHGDDGGDADDDAQRGEERAHLVAQERAPRDAHDVPGAHPVAVTARRRGASAARTAWRGASVRRSSSMSPSRTTITRRACAAMSGSWVTRMMVIPSLAELLEQRHHLQAGVRVEVAGRLVGQDEARPVDQRAGDRHPLLLAARELAGVVVEPLAEADPLQRLRGAAPAARAGRSPRVDQRQLDVLQRGGARQQVEALEDEAERPAAHLGQRVGVERARPPRRPASSRPVEGRSRQPRMFISVDLPEPEAPMMAANSPSTISQASRRAARARRRHPSGRSW